jgi:RNA ligase (TIGR02306 family)
MQLSTHTAEVVPINAEPLIGSDNLSVVKIHNYTVVINHNDWVGKHKAAYLPPDTLVKTSRPEFQFLAKPNKEWYRITAKRFNKFGGVISYGMLVPVPDHFNIGDDAWNYLELRRWEPNEGVDTQRRFTTSGEATSAPNIYHIKYDVDSFNWWASSCLTEGELILCTEKIHGTNSRYCYHNNEFYCSSHYEWKKRYSTLVVPTKEELLNKDCNEERANEIIEKIKKKVAHPKENIYWKALNECESLKRFCRNNPDLIVYGEIYGQVQKGFTYGCKPGEIKFVAFDILRDGSWVSPSERLDLLSKYEVPFVPILANSIPYSLEAVTSLAEGDSVLATLNGAECPHIREGCVVECVTPKFHNKIGRVKLKCINPEYLIKK